MPLFHRFLVATAVFLCLGCSAVHRSSTGVAPYLPPDLPATTGQILVVLGDTPPAARLFALQREGSGWRLFMGPLRASVGRNGFAGSGEKREGDGKSPAGLFPLESVFGYAPNVATAMPYRQATDEDLWVDDPDSPDYNTWVRKGETAAASYELMKLPDVRYRHGVVIGYNRNPVVRGAGSAIFLHAWLHPGGATAGCVALDEEELVRLIGWLDPAQRPMILMGPAGPSVAQSPAKM